MTTPTDADVPPIPPAWFQRGFHRFLRPYLRRHFHSLAIIARQGDPMDRIGFLDPAVPLIVYANHPSWWDPLIAHFINNQLFAPRQFYAPIDAEALQRYAVFGRLGFFGVRLNDRRGAADFLHVTHEILRRPATALWITPEGRFTDVRDHDAPLQPGIAHLATAIARSARRGGPPARAFLLPVALEYPFWQERLPECLAHIGTPFDTSEHEDWTKSDWSGELHNRLRATQRELAEVTLVRRSEPFVNLLKGKSGTGPLEPLRRAAAWWRGVPYRPAHGDAFENQGTPR